MILYLFKKGIFSKQYIDFGCCWNINKKIALAPKNIIPNKQKQKQTKNKNKTKQNKNKTKQNLISSTVQTTTLDIYLWPFLSLDS